MIPLLQVEDLHAQAGGESVLRGVDLELRSGELHAVMGPTGPPGSGISSLANVLMGDPSIQVTSGLIRFHGEDITRWPPDVRGKAGLFLAFQHPEPVPGLPLTQFLGQALAARGGPDCSVVELRETVAEWARILGIEPRLETRFLNQGLSAQDRSLHEILQMAVLAPEIAILDEVTSPSQHDAVHDVAARDVVAAHGAVTPPDAVARGVREVRRQRPELASLVVTRYHQVARVFEPSKVHVLLDGRVVAAGGPELVDRIEQEGYESWRP